MEGNSTAMKYQCPSCKTRFGDILVVGQINVGAKIKMKTGKVMQIPGPPLDSGLMLNSKEMAQCYDCEYTAPLEDFIKGENY